MQSVRAELVLKCKYITFTPHEWIASTKYCIKDSGPLFLYNVLEEVSQCGFFL